MDSKTVLDLARTGNTEAIAFLLNQWLKPYYVMATVTAFENCLQVSLKGAQPPLPELFTDMVAGQLRQLDLPFEQVELRGYALDSEQPAWKQDISLSAEQVYQAFAFAPSASEKRGVSLSELAADESRFLAGKVAAIPTLSDSRKPLPNLAGLQSVQNFYLAQLKTPDEKHQNRLPNIIGLMGLLALVSAGAIATYNRFFPQTAVSQPGQTAAATGTASLSPRGSDSNGSSSLTPTAGATPTTSAAAVTKAGASNNTSAARDTTKGAPKSASQSASPAGRQAGGAAADAGVAKALEQLKAEYETFQVLAQYEPKLYQQLQEQLKAAARGNALTPQKTRAIGSNLGASVLPKYIQVTSDRTLLDFALTRFNLLQQQAKRQPEVCRTELATRGPNSISTSMSSNLKELDEVLAAVIQTGATKPIPTQDRVADQAVLAKVMTNMGSRHGDDFLNVTDPKVAIAPQKACEMMNDFWAILLNLPDAEAASALRALWAVKPAA